MFAQYLKYSWEKKAPPISTIPPESAFLFSMKTRWFTFYFFLITSTVCAQGTGMLWKITHSEMKDTSYLFGTIHIRDGRVFQYSDSLNWAIRHCDVMYGELDLMDKKAIRQQASSFMMPQGQSLRTYLSDSDYTLVKKYVKKHLGAYSLLLNKVKPIFISSLVSDDLIPKDEKHPLDMYLQEYAVKNGVKVGGIETIDEQVAVLDKMTIQEQADMLVEQIKNIEQEKVLMEQMLQIYLSENLDSLYALVSEEEMPDEFSDAIMTNRNKIMTERMIQKMQSQKIVLAVGAAHLCGPEGIIELLRKQGYIVQAIPKK